MLYKIMSYLFQSNDIYRYTPKAWHMLWCVFLLAIGTVTAGQGWLFFGITVSVFGILLGITILLGMNWDKAIEYWAQIEYVINAAAKIKDAQTRYELLKSMGYNVPASSITITERKEDEQGILTSLSIRNIPIPPITMQMIADKVLMSGDADFIEDKYSNIPGFRKIRKTFKDRQMLSQKNKTNPRLGYAFNKKGIDTLYQYASDGVKLELERRNKENR